MDNSILLLVISTNFILAFVLILMIFFLYNYILKNKSTKNNLDQLPLHPEIETRIKEIKKIKNSESILCPNHNEVVGEASCAICDQLFCKSCIKPFKNLHFCKEHLPLIIKNDWEEVLKIKTSTQFPEEGVKLYDLKKKIFLERNIPSYIETHYKIDVEDDHIETYLVLFSIKEQAQELKMIIKD
jgi:hypothetical protein